MKKALSFQMVPPGQSTSDDGAQERLAETRAINLYDLAIVENINTYLLKMALLKTFRDSSKQDTRRMRKEMKVGG